MTKLPNNDEDEELPTLEETSQESGEHELKQTTEADQLDGKMSASDEAAGDLAHSKVIK